MSEKLRKARKAGKENHLEHLYSSGSEKKIVSSIITTQMKQA